jgi:hypothetical protein
MIPFYYEGSSLLLQVKDTTCVEHGYSDRHCGLCIMAMKPGCFDSHPEKPMTNEMLSGNCGHQC